MAKGWIVVAIVCTLAADVYDHVVAVPNLQSDVFPCMTAADVLTIENSRSGDAMIKALAKFGYSRDLGPGVYDVHR